MEAPAKNAAWFVFAVEIIALVIAIVWSFKIGFEENDDADDVARQVRGNTFLWLFTLAALVVAIFVSACPVPRYL